MPFIPAFAAAATAASALATALTFVKAAAIVGGVVLTGYYLSKQDWNEKSPEESRAKPYAETADPYTATIQDATPAQRLILGEATVKGAICYARSTGPYIVRQYLIANHEIDDVLALVIDDNSYSTDQYGYVNADPYVQTVPVQVGTEIELQERKYLRAMFRLGRPNQDACPLLQYRFRDVPDSFRQWGHATATLELYRGGLETPKIREYREEHSLQPEWERPGWGARGPDPSFKVRGLKVYDPRTDRTVWTNNAALVTAGVLVNNSIVKGIDYDNIDLDALKYAADLCDEGFEIEPNRIYPRGAVFPKYTIDGVIETTDSLNSILERMLISSRGTMKWINNKYTLDISRRKPVVWTITDDDFTGNIQYSMTKKVADGVKNIRGRYRDEDGALVDAPVRTSPSNSDKTGDINVNLEFTRNSYRAQFIMKQILNELNLERRLRVTIGRIGIMFTTGDVISVASEMMPEINGVYEVVQTDMNSDATQVNVRLNEYDGEVIHNWQAGDENVDDHGQ